MTHQRADARKELRHGATLRLSGAAHQRAQRRADTVGATRRARTPALCERTVLASWRGSQE